jgi:multidrug transporter EmrE-like cation transporter
MAARGYLYVAITLALTVYAQLVLKWRMNEQGGLPDTGRGRYLLDLLTDPWIISAFGLAAVAAVAYLAALANLDLSRAYPVMALSFGIVVLGSAAFLGESVTPIRLIGIAIITLGVFVASR